MKEFRKAVDMLAPGERGLFIFTRGAHFKVNPDGTGSSGYWKIVASPSVDRVVVYVRDGDNVGVNELYSGELAGTKGGRSDGRRTVFLQRVRHVGFTREGWTRFAKSNVNPIRYLKRE